MPRPRGAAGGGLLVPSALTLLGLAILIGLGTWQLERKRWKEGLIATLSERLSAEPAPLPARETWGRLDPDREEFRRVAFSAEFLHDKEALVYTPGSALRPDVSGPGYWVFTPARLAGGSIVMVDRGFVPEARKDARGRIAGQVSGVVDLVGALRWPEQRSRFTPADNPAGNLWFVRDPASVAEGKGIAPVAPFYVAQEAPVPPGGLPRAGKLSPRLANNHLQYAVTWFGLALTLIGVFGAWVFRRWRD
jgi:surfeit locus 1 family protein